jgi:hypothetical protein
MIIKLAGSIGNGSLTHNLEIHSVYRGRRPDGFLTVYRYIITFIGVCAFYYKCLQTSHSMFLIRQLHLTTGIGAQGCQEND